MLVKETFKAIDNKLFVFGVQPVDIVLTLVGFLFVHGIFNSLVLDVILVLSCFLVAKKTKNRSENVFVVLYLFFITPPELSVSDKESIKL